MAARKKVIIVGGGVAGSNLAKSLEKKNGFDVALVDTKDYVEVLKVTVLLDNRQYTRLRIVDNHCMSVLWVCRVLS